MAPPAEGPLRSVLEAGNILHMASSAEGPGLVSEAGFNLLGSLLRPKILPPHGKATPAKGSRSVSTSPGFSKGSPRSVIEAGIHKPLNL